MNNLRNDLKRVSTIRLIQELAKYGRLTIIKSDLPNYDLKCVFRPIEDEYICDRFTQHTDDLRDFLETCACIFENGTSHIFDHVNENKR